MLVGKFLANFGEQSSYNQWFNSQKVVVFCIFFCTGSLNLLKSHYYFKLVCTEIVAKTELLQPKTFLQNQTIDSQKSCFFCIFCRTGSLIPLNCAEAVFSLLLQAY